MRFLPLLAANFLRRKIRTALTVGSFAVALFLFGLLVTVRGAFNLGVDAASADRILTTNKVSLIQPLPFAYKDRLARIPGVGALTYANWFGGVYQDEKNFFPQFAVDVATWRDVYREFKLGDDAWRCFLADKQGAIVGKTTALRFGFKTGDRIPLRGAIFPGLWEFNLCGIYTGQRPNLDLTQFWFRWDYLDEKTRDILQSSIGWFVIRLAPGADGVQVAKAIDRAFANSAAETRTQSESAFMSSFVNQMGNIQLLMLAIGGVVFFTLLLVTGNTMAMSVRERTGELAVLKTVGFKDRFLLVIVLAESLLLAALGGGLGLGAAKLLTLAGDPTRGLLPAFYLPPLGMAAGFALTLLVGLLAGLIPAWSAMRLPVVAALRRI